MILLEPVRVESILVDCGIDMQLCRLQLGDDLYAVPTLEWAFGPFADALREWIGTFKMRYQTNAFDCDKFARFAAWLAGYLHSMTPGHPAAGLTVGEGYYRPDTGGGHAINPIIVNVNGLYQLAWMEPQNQTRLTLSKKEVSSCFFAKF